MSLTCGRRQPTHTERPQAGVTLGTFSDILGHDFNKMSLVSFCFHFHDDAFIASVRNDQQSEIMNYKNLAIVIPLSILLIDFNPN